MLAILGLILIVVGVLGLFHALALSFVISLLLCIAGLLFVALGRNSLPRL